MLNFNLNISILLTEYPFLERFEQAARLNFNSVEFWWPAGEDLKAVARRIKDTGLQVALFNLDGGNLAAGERGLMNDPARQAQFRENVPVALELAAEIGCTRLNALAGKWHEGESREAQLEQVRDNLRWAAEQAQKAGVTLLVEGLNSWDNGPVIFTHTRPTVAFLDSVGLPNLQYQYDIYHMERMEGKLAATIREFAGRIGHIQVADSPKRGHPGSGEINWQYIFQTIEESGYSGSIGLEYLPDGATAEESVAWLPFDQRRSATNLRL